jgi:hypothetical protein
MTGRGTAVLLAVLVSAPAVARADEARTRDGGSTPDRGAVERHTGGQSHAGSGNSGSSWSGGSADHSGSGAYSAPPTDAQSRHPRAGTGTGYRHGRYNGDGYRFYGGGYYGYGGYYYDPFYYGYGYYPPYYYGGYYGYSPGYYRSRYRDGGSVRIQVEPSKTRVYVDGYYAGIVDDFDGIFQRLSLPPGRHEISLRMEGYKTHRFKVYVPVDQTLKIRYDMVRGDGEETEELLGKADQYARDDDRYDRDRDRRDRDDDRWERRRDADDDGDDLDRGGPRGTLALDVQPLDASVYVDGEFRGSGRQAHRIRVPEGRHRIEVVRPGFRTIARVVVVRRGAPVEVKIELERS